MVFTFRYYSGFLTVIDKISIYIAPNQNLYKAILLILTIAIEVIIGRRLLNKVVYRISICIKASKVVLAIVEAIKVGKKAIYKMRL